MVLQGHVVSFKALTFIYTNIFYLFFTVIQFLLLHCNNVIIANVKLHYNTLHYNILVYQLNPQRQNPLIGGFCHVAWLGILSRQNPLKYWGFCRDKIPLL